MSSLAHLLPGKTFRSASGLGRRIKIKSYTPGGRQAVIVDAVTGKSPRWILVRNLHPTHENRAGKAWETGYVLEEGN